MKLTTRIALRLSYVLIPLMALWGMLFYFAMVEEINDETDDALDTYSEMIIIRMLAGRELPPLNSGSNNSYSIVPVDSTYAHTHAHISYSDAAVYIPEKNETEAARILTVIFQDRNDAYYELKVATPTFERHDLRRAILFWVVTLYLLLLLITITLTLWVFRRNMQPLYTLLRWLDSYTPGRKMAPVPQDTTVHEFARLNHAMQEAACRIEDTFEQQKQFIGNASHELQTPLAVLGTRLEWLLDHTNPSEAQMGELLKMQRSLHHISRLNKTLLLLSKIENGQVPESNTIDLAPFVCEQTELYREIYADRNITCTVNIGESFTVDMNESLLSTLVNNLLKNAFVHSEAGAHIDVTIAGRTLSVENDGTAPLDADHIFDRFYQGERKPGSTGLGLALAKAVCRYYHIVVSYRFVDGRHRFSVAWP